MKSKLSFILSVLCALLVLTACQAGQAPDPESAEPPAEATEPEAPAPEPEAPADPSLSQRERDWIEDIEYLRKGLKEGHMDPFYICSEEELDFMMDRLIARVGQLSDNDIAFEILKVVAAMGDLHSQMLPYLPLYERYFPASAAYFDGKLYLVNYLEGYEQFAPYLLHEIVAVNGIDIAYLDQKASEITTPYNRWSAGENFTYRYFLPSFYDWAGCDYKEGYTFQILNDNQEVESVEVPTVTAEERKDVKRNYPENWDQLLYRKGRDMEAYVEGENGGLVYMCLATLYSESTLKYLVENTAKLLEEHPECGKLVIDLRECPGGNLAVVDPLLENVESLRTDHTYVLTDGTSASAAITLMAFFKNKLDAVFVGEPTAQFTSFFHLSSSEKPPLVLPHSQISIDLSDLWRKQDWWNQETYLSMADPAWGYDEWELTEEYYDEDGKLYPWENTILPDVYVYQDIEDIRQGKDSVIEWVLAQER